MVDRAIREQLLKKLGVTRQALSKRSGKIKDKYGPMTTEEAVYVVAHMEGIDLSKHLPLGILDRIRSLVPRHESLSSSASKIRKPDAARHRKPLTIQSYPLLSQVQVGKSVVLGSDVFPLIYQTENSIREFILKRLSKADPNWWNTKVPGDVQRNVANTIAKEKRYPYRDKRGSQPIFYTNFIDLKKIVASNHTLFIDAIPDLDWFKVRMDEVYMARNNLAHCVPLAKDDVSRIALFHRDWARLLGSVRI